MNKNAVSQGYPPPLQVYSDPLSDYNNNTSPNAMNSTVPIPGTHVPANGQVPMLLIGRQVITGGNDGPLYINPRRPNTATNSRMMSGQICPTCGKGILIVETNLNVCEGASAKTICLLLCCPLIGFLMLMNNKSKCSSCKAEFQKI
jgi:hypothetical protein